GFSGCTTEIRADCYDRTVNVRQFANIDAREGCKTRDDNQNIDDESKHRATDEKCRRSAVTGWGVVTCHAFTLILQQVLPRQDRRVLYPARPLRVRAHRPARFERPA